MIHYIGIDLGTTNSAICSFDGENLRLYKSSKQNDVTPSAIFYNRRGSKYVGLNAYEAAAWDPDNSATLFKRFMGTSTPFFIKSQNLKLTPEECSAEILRTLFGYLPEEIRNNRDIGTVITVPAAFNQMQKDATLNAAEMAGIGKVALMQEPVAAVMSVMRLKKTDGVFLIYDLGGGTLDVALAQNIAGRVSLLSHGGIEMCGGRDWDRLLFDNIVKPWLLNEFNLPEDFIANPKFRQLHRPSILAIERAKIELSAKDSAIIDLDEGQLRIKDLSGEDIYLHVPLNRKNLDALIEPKVSDSIEAARRTLNNAGFSSHDVERIVFIGGPTHYKPLRDMVAFELSIPSSTDMNPMTAVAEGAALFAESIDWSSQRRGRKSSRGTISANGNLNLDFNFIARTPAAQAKIVPKVQGEALEKTEFQIDCLDTGWSSGRLPLKNGEVVVVTLSKFGENTFKAFVFDSSGGPISLEQDKIVITRTAATVDAIPASYSVAFEVLDKLGGTPILDYLIKAGDPLPYKGSIKLKAAESLRAGGKGSLNFKIWEGQIEDTITDNRFIGMLKITGDDFDEGVIVAGADLNCVYEILDSGNIVFEITVPSIGSTFHSGHKFFSRQEGQLDFSSASKTIIEEANRIEIRIDEIAKNISDTKLDLARNKVTAVDNIKEDDPEACKQAWDDIYEAKRILSEIRVKYRRDIRKIELDNTIAFFNEYVRDSASSSEVSVFENLVRTAKRSINNTGTDFDNLIDRLRSNNWEILWRQDGFVIENFKILASEPHLFFDKQSFEQLVMSGNKAIQEDDIDGLRSVIGEMYKIRTSIITGDDMLEVVNILRG